MPLPATIAKLLRGAALCASIVALLCLTQCSAPLDNAFMGDSITSSWALPGANLGVPGNVTAQMLARFPSEVPDHGFRVFILLGGTNDLRYHRGIPGAIANITTMAKSAKDAGMVVVLSELPPDYEDPPLLFPEAMELNGMIKALAQQQGYLLVDYWDPMIGHPEYFRDKLHPNALGYAVMNNALTPVLESIPAK